MGADVIPCMLFIDSAVGSCATSIGYYHVGSETVNCPNRRIRRSAPMKCGGVGTGWIVGSMTYG